MGEPLNQRVSGADPVLIWTLLVSLVRMVNQPGGPGNAKTPQPRCSAVVPLDPLRFVYRSSSPTPRWTAAPVLTSGRFFPSRVVLSFLVFHDTFRRDSCGLKAPTVRH
ncbi:hypothetical protein EYF80_009002 [Liparis tanakae]|uniref:Secreted protein n=1 Tax=Liparis tanakae TaxID=230148 RepID=A0A4Z2IT42_9TELE|nr:hypothetical protein EYF80_009002 [Liparis tanakae]